jgi:hypothetical protein
MEDLIDHLDAERHHLEQYAANLESYSDGDLAPGDLAHALVAAQELHKTLGTLVDDIEQRLIAEQTEHHGKIHEYKGLGTFEVVRSSTKTTWDHKRLLGVAIREAVEHRLDEPGDDGEILSPQAAIEKVLSDCAAFSYWRLGALEQYGIEGRDFREQEPGRKRIKRTN